MWRWTSCGLKWLLSLQLALLVLRQSVDFLGAMWLPIIVNFLSIIVTITGLFHYHAFYCLYQPLLIGYNLVVMAFYLNVGRFDRDTSTLLNLGTGSKSYWFSQANYYGSQCTWTLDELTITRISSVPAGGVDQEPHVHCSFIPFFVIESLQAALHIIVSVFACIVTVMYVRDKKRFSPAQDDAYGRTLSSPSSTLPRYSMTYGITGRQPSTSASLRRKTRNRSSTHSLSSQRRASSVRKSRKRRERAAARLQQTQQSPITKLLYNYGCDSDSILSSDNIYGGGLANPLYYGSRCSISQSQHLYDTTSLTATIERSLPLPPPPPTPPPPPPPPHHHNRHNQVSTDPKWPPPPPLPPHHRQRHPVVTNGLFNIHQYYQQLNSETPC